MLLAADLPTRGSVVSSEPDLADSMDESPADMDWRFWITLTSLVVMTARQLRHDVQAITAWAFPSTPSIPESVLSATMLEVSPTDMTVETTTTDGTSMLGPVGPDTGSSSAASVPPPSVPIFVSRYGEKYHYREDCSGLRLANQKGIESKILCKTCDVQRKR